MLNEFRVYLELGFRHIADLAGYDHILFVVALAIPFGIRDWRRLAVLVTAFTLGHSLTLALATMRLVSVSSNVVETLIPATILFTALDAYTSATPQRPENPATVKRYGIALLFGLVHGLGFSSYLRALLGDEESIALPLLAFNVGLEMGQLVILSIVLTIGAALVPAILQRRRWVQILVGVTGGLALMLLVQRLRAWS
ncbi:HupE/UreJ family protein [Gemmatimonas sp.]|uniref:HupE/UreJ family protein n=1 Tax=Gemmatimonas sp. TaxID=1962908 RepID=UPI00286E0969|nr:HupE/UreJ family protein [Gemmatimonas sp.]